MSVTDGSLAMNQPPYPTILVPINLGPASSFNRAIFPLSYRKANNLERSDYYLDATLDEMLRMTKIGLEPQQWQKIIAATRRTYNQLTLRKAELEQRPKSKNFIKRLLDYRATRMLLAASKALYKSTRSQSEEMARLAGRSMLALVAKDVQSLPEDEDPPPDANLEIAVKLDRPLDEATQQQLLDVANAFTSRTGIFGANATFQSDAFSASFATDTYFTASESLISVADASTTDEEDDETPDTTTSPTSSSPSTIIQQQIIYNINNSIHAEYSTIQGATAQIGGTQNSGSVNRDVIPL